MIEPRDCQKCGMAYQDFLAVYGMDGEGNRIILSYKCPICFPESIDITDNLKNTVASVDAFVKSLPRRSA